MPEATNDPAKAIERLNEEVRFLRKLLFLHQAQLDPVHQYAIWQSSNPSEAQKQIADLIRQAYDKWIEQLEKDNPGYAADVDARPELDENQQMKWYFPKDK